MADDKNYILTTCRGCGNKGLLKKVAEYEQDYIDYSDGVPDAQVENLYVLLECPVCNSISLYNRYHDSHMLDYEGNEYYDEGIQYPEQKKFTHVPENILKSYKAAVQSSKFDLSISLIAIRAVLEKICKERGTNRKTLEAMLKQMVERHILPETLDKCGFVIRKMGNSGAHGDDDSLLTTKDIAELMDFIETIMYYIYELPVKVENLNRKYDLKMEQTEQREEEIQSNLAEQRSQSG